MNLTPDEYDLRGLWKLVIVLFVLLALLLLTDFVLMKFKLFNFGTGAPASSTAPAITLDGSPSSTRTYSPNQELDVLKQVQAQTASATSTGASAQAAAQQELEVLKNLKTQTPPKSSSAATSSAPVAAPASVSASASQKSVEDEMKILQALNKKP